MHASPATPAASLTRARAPRAFRAPTSPAAALRPSWTASSARGIRTRVAARAACPSSSVAARGLTQRHVLAAAPGTRAAAVALPGDAAARSPLLRQNPRRRARVASRAGPVRVRALVNVDLGPSAILGASVMLSAIGLYQVRASRPEVSRDQDVFFSSVGLLTGGILVFQGWRLDPLMLFGQLLTAATAVSFASEAIGLRQEVLDREARMEQTERDRGYAARRDPRGRGRGGGGGGRGGGGGGYPKPDARRTRPAPLPPPSARAAPFDQWREQPRGQFRDRDQPRGRAWNQDEYAFDASVDAPRGGVEGGVEGGFEGGFGAGSFPGAGPNGGFMDGFDDAVGAREQSQGQGQGDWRGRRGETSGDPRGSERRRDSANRPSAEGAYDADFRPGRFGDDADDWEL